MIYDSLKHKYPDVEKKNKDLFTQKFIKKIK